MNPNEVLSQYFGYPSFRPGQEDLITTLLSGHDVVGIMPTGAGKSICYQVPALLFPGITLVISPLISLMQDQVRALIQAGIPAAYINSALTPAQIRTALENARYGQYKLIYVAPERLLTPDFLDFATTTPISMVTVDEAHCISHWGQDFRPSYLDIPTFLSHLPARPVVSAFTATATKRVEEDIAQALTLRNPTVLVTGFNRENLYFSVETPQDKTQALLDFLFHNPDQSGIIYCATRKNVEEVCAKLQERGYAATRYHAGLPDGERRENQNDFLYDKSPIMVATNAFGMGIDKPNVSFVVHYNMPKDLESYYQEAGRAGRDGRPAKCTLFYAAQDVELAKWMIEHGRETLDADPQTLEAQINQELQRLKKMTGYATSYQCLRGYILRYFGENPPDRCGDCGVCHTQFTQVEATVDAQKLLSCVARTNQRFGANLVIEVLRGSKTKRVFSQGFQNLSTYGICKKPVVYLNALVRYLCQEGYLAQSVEKYPILSLTATSNQVLKGQVAVIMPMPKEVVASATRNAAPKTSATQLSPDRQPLYNALAGLRTSLAQSQGVPAFVIFGDRTLLEMCLKLPQTPQEFREISGVGDTKLDRYGPDFLEIIHRFAQNPSLVAEKAPKTAKRKAPAQLVLPDQEILGEIPLSDSPLQLSSLTSLINDAMEQYGCSLVNFRHLSDWLIQTGYLQTSADGGGKIPTQRGLDMGMTQESRTRGGNTYSVNLYPAPLQALIIQAVPAMLEGSEHK